MDSHQAAVLDGGTELRPIYRHEIDELARPRETQRFHCQYSGRLNNGLHEQYTRHDWPPGKMPLKERLVDRNRLYCMDGLFKFHCFHAVISSIGKRCGSAAITALTSKIGRASCRKRVCQYV